MTHYQGYGAYRQHWLFKIIRAVVVKMAGEKCEVCGGKYTEVHHKQYPAWGAFDTPANMMAVCHECHKKIHNREK